MDTSLCHAVFLLIIKLAVAADEQDVLVSFLDQLDVNVAQWKLDKQQEREFYQVLSQGLTQHDDLSHDYLLKAVYTWNGQKDATSEKAKLLATQVVKQAISLDHVFLFDDIVALDAVKSIPKPLMEFLRIFSSESLDQYKAFLTQYPNFLKEYGFDQEQCLHKIRVLTLVSLCSKQVNGELKYDVIAKALEIGLDTVEFWIINAVRAKLIDVKMNQETRVAQVNRATFRVFGSSEWNVVSEKLAQWKDTMQKCLLIVQASQ